MKLFKKMLVFVLALVMVLPVIGCGGQTANTTVIEAFIWDGGYGTEWFYESAKRFEESVATKEYIAGKPGVKIEISKSKSSDASTMNSSGIDVYVNNDTSSAKALANKGWLANLTEIVTVKDEDRNGTLVSIEDKIDPEFRSLLKGNDGNYYALPFANTLSGLTYDRELFDAMNLYIADPVSKGVNTVDDVVEHTAFGTTVNFVFDKNVKKSCGSDGTYGTYDDGLPTSITELLVLCDYIKVLDASVAPFHFTGANPGYSRILADAIAGGLSRVESAKVSRYFTGKTTYVTGYSSESIFPEINYIKKPTTETVDIDETNGYLTTRTKNAYYGYAFMEIAYREGWFSDDANNSNASHLDAQSHFLCSGLEGIQKSAMFIEGSYWFTEAKENGKLDTYKLLSGGKSAYDRDLRWMPLPVTIDTVINEGEGVSRYTTVSARKDFVYMNANALKKEGTAEACLDFIKFMHSDSELVNFTASTGLMKSAMDYDFTAEDVAKLSSFQQSVLEMRKDLEVVVLGTGHEIFENNFETFTQRTFFPSLENRRYNSALQALKAKNKDGEYFGTKDIFEAIAYSESDWAKFCAN